MFEAEMSSDAWQVAGMADNGQLPKILGRRNSHGVPLYGVLLSAMGIALLGCLSFDSVIDMLNLLYCLGQIIEFVAFLHLRATQPNLHRPYRIPMNLFGCSVLLSFPLIFIGIIIYFSSPIALLFTVLCATLGVGVYHLLKLAKMNEWCEFANELDNVDLSVRDESEGDGLSQDEYLRSYHTSVTKKTPPRSSKPKPSASMAGGEYVDGSNSSSIDDERTRLSTSMS
jgi:amino acid permease